MSKIEVRTNTGPIEVRKTGDKLLAVGYAIRYNRLSQNLGGFVERCAPGCADKTIKEQDIRALFNHESSNLLGRVGSGTLRVSSDSEGVPYEIDLPDTTLGRDVGVLLERGDVQGASFGFVVMPDGDSWGATEQGFPLRTLTEILLKEISLVPNPAYLDSSSALRSLSEATGRTFEEVRSLAERNELMSLIGIETYNSSEDKNDDDSRAQPTVQHRSHLTF